LRVYPELPVAQFRITPKRKLPCLRTTNSSALSKPTTTTPSARLSLPVAVQPLHAGATFNDPLLESLLLDRADKLRIILNSSPLHICAEYNSIDCARVLLDAGHPVDATAAIDANGLGGHSPVFHTVNSNRNYCRPRMELLADAGASLDVHLKGIVWGSGFEWETTILEVTPLSYAQCGLYFQFHRREDHLYSNLAYLYQKSTTSLSRRAMSPTIICRIPESSRPVCDPQALCRAGL